MAAAVALASVSPASAESHAGKHLLKVDKYNAHPLRAGNLGNHGGPVQNSPVVYIVFWGWAADPSGEQSYLTGFLSAVGGSSWLAPVTEYGGGSKVILAGTWSDPSAVPTSPSDDQIQAEAANAAAHFGAGNSVNVQIVVATPTGHSTSGFGTQYCAYHDAVASDPDITYTNLPYMTDAGADCGAGRATGNALDGVSLLEGAELADTITDPLLNAWYSGSGSEIAGMCFSSQPDFVHGFPVPKLWSNALGRCV